MRSALFHLERKKGVGIQTQIREMLVNAILSGSLPGDEALPSCRNLAKQLGVSRNTVVLAYQGLVDDGYLYTRERSGYFVNGEIVADKPVRADSEATPTVDARDETAVDWQGRFRRRLGRRSWSYKQEDWQNMPYPFLYGQMDYNLFPIAAWRECSRQAMGRRMMADLTTDAYDADDPDLIEQIRTRLLPRRGIAAKSSEILVTLGAQNALYLLGALFLDPDIRVGIEDPGYPDARLIFRKHTDLVEPLPVDSEGLIVDRSIAQCRYVFVTPSHHYPTTVTMSMARRRALLQAANEHDFLIFEDDYEPESNFVSNPAPALKSLDEAGRVVYLGSFSKSLFPGLRLGYMVAPEPLIEEMRALRRLMYRHPPSNNQRTAALFLAQGHYDSLVTRLQKAYQDRWQAMQAALDRHLPNASKAPSYGGSSFWVRGPENLDSVALAQAAREEGVVLEPCIDHFADPDGPRHFFRLGYSSIPAERIEPGVKIIAGLVKRLCDG